MLKRIRNSYITKGLAVLLAFNLIGEIVVPTIAFGLTSGPIDINQASFEPASTSEMVNLATGDFTYNIPLMDVDGYPINIAYHGGVSMEQEASIVGTGWTLNVGAMNRMKRGLPDDFKGDEITTEMNLRPRTTTGGSIGLGVEIIGKEIETEAGETVIKKRNFIPTASGNIGVSFNNYTGYSLDFNANGSFAFGTAGSFKNIDLGIGMGAGVGLESSSQNGLSISPNASISPSIAKAKMNLGIGFTSNTTTGLQNINISSGLGGRYGDAGVSGSSGISRSSSIQISTLSYTPSITFENNISSLNFDFDLGKEYSLVYKHLKGAFHKTKSCLKETVQYSPAYGYLYEDHKKDNENFLLDFNRTGEVLPNKNIAFLPVTNHTFDVYSATAQGVAFSSRPFRSDILVVSDASKEHTISGLGVSGEYGVGIPVPPIIYSFQAGLNTSFSRGFVKSGKWESQNSITDIFKANETPSHLYEKVYFKKLGNRSGSSTDFYNNLQGDKPLAQDITEAGPNHIGGTGFHSDLNDDDTYTTHDFSTDDHYRNQRDLRNTNIQYLTADEATSYGFDHIKSHALNDFDYTGGNFSVTTLPRYGTNMEDAKKHHISEMTVLKGDGSRYVYGIPVINNKTEEVTFNVSNEYPDGLGTELTADCQTGLIDYDAGVDNSTNNRRGDNNLFIKKTVPASANSNLLSAYLSSNYVDRTGNGPTPDDFGGYTKFNYSKVSSNLQPTKWRIPFEKDKAAYNEGLKTNNYDDMASYVYGEREQWLVHSIESKNFVAVFEYGDREDAYGVADENGGIASYNNSKRLISIALYTRQALENNEAPIKTVHFEYNYDLCPGVPNNAGGAGTDMSGEVGVANDNGGKLTLTGIYFTYGESNRGKLHKYTFDYSGYNPPYNLGETDRWGSYRENTSGASCNPDDPLTNFEFPYSSQDESLADLRANAWSLSTIHLPSGSKIDIELEADDYSYVMEKEASKMFMIRGMSEGGGTAVESVLYDGDGDKNYIHVALDQGLGSDYDVAKTTFIKDYVGDIEQIYFKYMVSVSNEEFFGLPTEQFEYVSGYATIDRNDLYVSDEVGGDGIYDTGLIRLKSVHIRDKEKEPSGDNGISPISKASWQFMRKYLPQSINPIVGNIYTSNDAVPYGYSCAAFDEDLPDDTDTEDPSPSEDVDSEGAVIRNMYNIGKSHYQNMLSLGGINFMMKTQGYASRFKPNKSWVRLYQGTSNKKIGGGHRVKQISVTDNWKDVKPLENTSTYGTQYKYTKIDDDNTTAISSGVASYEPISSGSDENTYREPQPYTIDVAFRVNDDEFQEKLLGESIFATSQVSYSQVEVQNLDYADLDNGATGKTIYEFYTAKDFPSVVSHTDQADATRLETKSKPWMDLITNKGHNYLTMTQGYSIQINDMHGKFKSKTVLADSPIDGTNSVIYAMRHKYYTAADNSKKLKNEMNVVSEAGVVSTKLIGKDIDMVMDLVESESYHENIALQFNVEGNLYAALPPVIVPSFWMSTTSQSNRFRSSVTTKVVYSNGILEEIELEDKGRVKKTKNLLFDENTGVPIVTKVEHEIGNGSKPIYQYDYPAYWMYDGMGLASENWGANFTDIANSDAKITLAGFENFLNPGDEIAVSEIDDVTSLPSFVGKYWVLKNETSGDYYLIDRYGDKATYYDVAKSYDYKVIRSGKRNLLGSTAASVTSLSYDEDAYTPSFAHSDILNASAVEYTEEAFGYESDKIDDNGALTPEDVYQDLCGLVEGQKVNPYVQGLRANWNLLASYVFDGDRDQASGEIRSDGTLDNYIAFWKNTAGNWGINPDGEVAQKWIKAAIATIFEREGYNLESKDALGIYSSIQLGYNKTLKVAEAVNARYYEVGFEGFEDLNYDQTGDCSNPHFRFENGTIINNPALAHSGRHSIRVAEGDYSYHQSPVVNNISHNTSDHGAPYIIQAEELISTHNYIIDPTESRKFVLTAWAHEENTNAQVLTFDGADININIPGVTIIQERRSNIIDGWQRIEIEFSIAGSTPAPGESGKIELHNESESNAVYFDDIRIQPYNSEMVSYVIDPVSLRLWATLDSRNFATFYQYDEEGSLVRIIQETERGKVTVQENRAGIRIE